MRHLYVSFLLLFMCSFSTSNDYVRVDMEKGFFYQGNLTNSNIFYKPGYDDNATVESSKFSVVIWPVVRQVESFGFNATYILATGKSKTGFTYWLIDKTQDPKEVGAHEKGGRIVLANVRRIGSLKFHRLQKDKNIKIYPISHYQTASDEQ